ncbi:YlmH family RNA-binding protein [Streptococcus marmotae]|uniref:YlmH family RNA-binding protein n=1 Tax=Streptococcus marmotae TaxID=1825069 RepID=UPI0008307833|nr:YlmH/Sll1252 family protein [Streptococcus marmotae]
MKQLFQHFSKDEKEFVEQMIDLCQQVDTTYSYRLTRFLNPRQNQIAASIAAHFQLVYFSSQEELETEFSRGIIAPDYYQLDVAHFELAVVEVLYPRKYHEVTHSQILGTLLHRLGIKREYVGDILVGEDQTFVVLDRKFLPLLQSEVAKIGRTPVSWKEREWEVVSKLKKQEAQQKQILVSSLRLDKLISVAFQLSRTSASKLIEARQVKLDYQPIAQAGHEVDIGQLISVRGYGRVCINELVGYSKQGKLKLEIEVIRK